MATTKQRVSVTRIPRHIVTKISPNENQDHIDKDPSPHSTIHALLHPEKRPSNTIEQNVREKNKFF
jgi:hypothetical protein